jgi:hypothetical protein
LDGAIYFYHQFSCKTQVNRERKFEPDPREIGSAFHGAGREIGQKRIFFRRLNGANGG